MTRSDPPRQEPSELPLQERYDALLFDLDGVVYVGPTAVPGAAAAIDAARRAGAACGFITNNASRSPDDVAAHLSELEVPASAADVITSPQAAVSVLADHVAAGAAVLVIGGPGIEAALTAGGYRPVRSLDDEPAAVMQGFAPDVSWRDLAMATFAVRAGLPWIATNPDLTFPTPGGVAPGNGALVRVVAETAGRWPDAVAGKPEPPLLLEAIRRLSAVNPLMIGDRLDTDIVAGSRIGIPTLLVFTGVTDIPDLLAAEPAERPTYFGPDLGILGEGYPEIVRDGDEVRCRGMVAKVVDGRLHLDGHGDRWDGIRAGAAAVWRAVDDAQGVDREQAAGLLGAR